MNDQQQSRAAVRVCTIADAECSRGCGSGACKRKQVDAPTEPNEHATLMRFYNVATTDDLIAAMARHIEKLQSKVPSASDQFSASYRNG